MTQEPTPTPDDEIAVIARALCDLPDTCTLHREKAARIHAALKSAGYELVNQVGTVHHEPDSWQHIVGGPSTAPTATDNQVINPPLVELTARWIGERESTHTWPEIREDDKACYRDAARHLLDTLSGRGAFSCKCGVRVALNGADKDHPSIQEHQSAVIGAALKASGYEVVSKDSAGRKVTEDDAREASEGLDYLTDTARGHDYADNNRINDAADAVAYVLDAHGYRFEPDAANVADAAEDGGK